MKPSPVLKSKLRCAVYTRKSSEEGLEQEFNSLDAQREACEAYVTSQKTEGWILVPDRYDDGGVSGGTLERPALRRLIADIEAGRINIVVVYKIDRLSRSLMDFARLVDVFDRTDVTFVSVTQSFNTTTSMGRLTLNVLLSFAQFEREVIGERIRDKFAASRRKGIWMGGWTPLGYDVRDRKLIVNTAEAKIVRSIFQRFAKVKSATQLTLALRDEGIKNKQGSLFDKGSLYKLLNNRTYLGDAMHKGTAYPGEHDSIVDREIWDRVHAIFREDSRKRSSLNRNQQPALLKGILFDVAGNALTPTHTRRRGRRYCYYMVSKAAKQGARAEALRRISAGEIERVVLDQIRKLVRTPEVIVSTCRAVRKHDPAVTERAVRDALRNFDALWDELFPAEQARIVRLLVERIEVSPNGADIRLRTEGVGSLFEELRPARSNGKAEAA